MSLSITTFSIMTLSIMTVSTVSISTIQYTMSLSIKDAPYNDTWPYEIMLCYIFIAMPSVVMLFLIMLSAAFFITTLSVVMPSAVLLSVAAPRKKILSNICG
jgi:hypothetical protein